MTRDEFNAEMDTIDARKLAHWKRADEIEAEARTHRPFSKARREGKAKARDIRANASTTWGILMDRLMRQQATSRSFGPHDDAR